MGRANTHLIYGESGTFKTTQIGFLARYVWKKYHKRTRLISADGGGWFPIQRYVDAGIIIPYSVGPLIFAEARNSAGELKSVSPMGIVRKLAKGLWPKQVGGTNVARLMPTTAEEWAEIGAYAIEGLTSLGDLFMEELRRDQRKIGEDAVGSFTVKVEDSEERFSANNRAHYNFVQNEVHGLVRAFSSLPVENVFFSAHEGKGEDEATKEAIRGPAIVGKAATNKVPTWVGDCIHADSYSVQREFVDPVTKFKSVVHEPVVRMWFIRHPDETFKTIYYPAKLRVDPTLVAAVRKEYPGGYFMPTTESGLDALLDLEDRLMSEASQRTKEELTV